MKPDWQDKEHGIKLYCGDCLEIMPGLDPVDSVVTDPPYGINFMGKSWDYDVPTVDIWREVLGLLKSGGHLLSFAGTRTQHRMAINIEDAGFDIRDMIAWVYGSGFPKSLDISKAIDKYGGNNISWFGKWLRAWRKENKITQKEVSKLFPSKTGGLTGCVANWELGLSIPTPEQFSKIVHVFNLPFETIEDAQREIIGKYKSDMGGLGGERLGDKGGDITAPESSPAKQWDGWGTALKPALEPITLARKPILTATIAANVLEHGTGGLNIEGCRVGTEAVTINTFDDGAKPFGGGAGHDYSARQQQGRWPANLIHDGSAEVQSSFPIENEKSAARFFYCAKTGQRERNNGCDDLPDNAIYTKDAPVPNRDKRPPAYSKNGHPTVKPVDLMQYLCRLITPLGGIVLDCFAGSGSTGLACIYENFKFVGIERDPEYFEIMVARIKQEIKDKRGGPLFSQ